MSGLITDVMAIFVTLLEKCSFLQVDVTSLVCSSLKVVDPDVVVLLAGAVLQGRAVGTTAVQVANTSTLITTTVFLVLVLILQWQV